MSDELDEVIDEINEDYAREGKPVAGTARKHRGFNLETYSSGIFSMDVAMDGGIPRGKIMRVFGKESSGKTTTLLNWFASAQRTCSNCNSQLITHDETRFEIFNKVEQESIYSHESDYFEDVPSPNYKDRQKREDCIDQIKSIIEEDIGQDPKKFEISDYRKIIVEDCTVCNNPDPMQCVHFDVEMDWDNDYANALGVDTEEIKLVQVEYTEKGIDSCDKMLRTGKVDLFGLDSWAALTPSEEIKNDSDHKTVGTHAKLANSALRRWISSIGSLGIDDSKRPTLVLINQYRMDINSGSFTDPRVTPGGKGQNYASSVDVEMLKPDDHIDKEAETMDSKDDVIYAKDFRFQIKKNKTVTEGRAGTYKMYTRDYIDDDGNFHPKGKIEDEENVLDIARDHEIIYKDGSKYCYDFGDDTIEESRLGDLKDRIRDDRELFRSVREDAKAVLM